MQDIDAGDIGYPEFVPEYAKEIYVYWSDLEVCICARARAWCSAFLLRILIILS